MKKVIVKIKDSAQLTYPILIGENIVENLGKLINFSKYSKVVLITDKHIEKLLLKQLPQFLPENSEAIVMPVGERSKTIDTVEEIWRELLDLQCDRKTLVVNMGGGVILDMAGFAASTFMRGLDFINIPTTLLSQVDASVGGKTGVNFLEVKNLIGTFNQPIAVIIDVALLQTLPERDFIAGFGEIIKTGAIADKKFFDFVTSKKPKEFSQKELVSIIEKSIKIKAQIIEKDQKETSLRKLLNFGHTVGHAVEILSQTTDNPLLHGEAVAIGMVAEAQIAVEKNLLKQNALDLLIEKILFAGLPIKAIGIKANDIVEKMQTDKKNENGCIKFTLLKTIGQGIINQDATDSIIKTVVGKIL